jgi:hypothetical protein
MSTRPQPTSYSFSFQASTHLFTELVDSMVVRVICKASRDKGAFPLIDRARALVMKGQNGKREADG